VIVKLNAIDIILSDDFQHARINLLENSWLKINIDYCTFLVCNFRF
jgi:hypothetical protein